MEFFARETAPKEVRKWKRNDDHLFFENQPNFDLKSILLSSMWIFEKYNSSSSFSLTFFWWNFCWDFGKIFDCPLQFFIWVINLEDGINSFVLINEGSQKDIHLQIQKRLFWKGLSFPKWFKMALNLTFKKAWVYLISFYLNWLFRDFLKIHQIQPFDFSKFAKKNFGISELKITKAVFVLHHHSIRSTEFFYFQRSWFGADWKQKKDSQISNFFSSSRGSKGPWHSIFEGLR